MRFVDRVRILVRAGDGGNGAVAWRREAHVPKGGPAGGDGGSGGDIVLVASEQRSTLLDLKFRQQYRAEAGVRGATKCMHGRAGEDLEVLVPPGTAVYFEGLGEPGERPPWADDASKTGRDEPDVVYISDESEGDEVAGGYDLALLQARAAMQDGSEQAGMLHDGEAEPLNLDALESEALTPRQHDSPGLSEGLSRGELVCDLVDDGERAIVARGGLGGRGNVHFRSSQRRAPDFAEPGGKGEGFWLRLELKLLADVGIVGFPNVGKSTLIRQISRARPEVGAYPFTTLTPQLGVVDLGDERNMVVADVPGLVEGASAGRGLGHQFLRHLERTRVLLHLLAPDPTEGRSPLRDLKVLEQELRSYGDMFDGRPRVVALNKCDTDEAQELQAELAPKLAAMNIPLFPISAVTGEGVDRLLEALWRRVDHVRRRSIEATRGD